MAKKNEIPKLAPGHQPTLRRLYDALREECRKASPPGNLFGDGYTAGLNRAIDIMIELNGGYAPGES